MSKRTSFNIRLYPTELEKYKTSLESFPEIPNLSEMFRKGIEDLITNGSPLDPLSLGPMEGILEKIDNLERRLDEEISKNSRKLDLILQHISDQQHDSSQKLQQQYTQQLIDYWLTDPETLIEYSSIEDLEDSIRDIELFRDIQDTTDIVMEAIKILKQSKRLEISKANKLRWNL